MKKRTLSILAISIVFTFATLTSCGGGDHKETTSTKETTIEETVETATETSTEETVADSQVGSDLFTANACVSCHQIDNKTVGPSLKDIATGYADNKAGLTAFLKGESEPIIDPAQAAVMANLVETTKKMNDDERDAIATYILSNN